MNAIQCSPPSPPARVLSAINDIHSPASAIMLSRASNLEEAHHKTALPATRCRHSLNRSFSQFAIESDLPVVDPRESVIPHSAIGNLSSSPNSARVMPRSRGVPRRGGSSASRGRTRSSPSPLVIPISSASPSSPPLSPARPVPNSSFHNSRFTFRSRLNQPVITFTTTIMVSEDAEEPVDPSSSSTPSPEASISQGPELHHHPSATNMQEDSPKNAEVFGTPIIEEDDVVACGPVQRTFDIMHLITQSEEGAGAGNPEDDADTLPAMTNLPSTSRPDPQSSGK